MTEETQITLRDTIEDAFDKAETVEPVEKAEPIKAEPTETAEQKADRIRDEKGRFAEGEKQAKAAKTEITTEAPVKARPQRPSSWKKEMWDHWEKLDPNVAEYLTQREREFANGVSTYKKEWESAKPILDAMAPFNPILQQHNIQPQEWIRNLGTAHQMLAMGSPQDKLSMFLKLAEDYQVPLQNLLTQGQDGKVYYNPQVKPWQPQPQQTDMRQVVKEVMQEQLANQQVQQFAEKPYFSEVRETMAGILQAGLAQDLNSAYEVAINLPIHANIREQIQKEKTESDLKRKSEEAAKAVSSAKAKAVSPRSSTPAGNVKTGDGKGLRSQLDEAFDSVFARV